MDSWLWYESKDIIMKKSDLIYLSEETYFLVPCVSTIWSHVSLVFKMLVWFDFPPYPLCFVRK